MKATCSLCQEERDISEYHYRKDTGKYYKHCKECHKKMVNKNYADNSERYLAVKKEYHSNNTHVLTSSAMRYYKKNPEKREAHVIVSRALNSGELIRPDICEMCGSSGRGKKSRIHAHHDDYSKPLDVTWLCARCHKHVHLGRSKNECL